MENCTLHLSLTTILTKGEKKKKKRGQAKNTIEVLIASSQIAWVAQHALGLGGGWRQSFQGQSRN